MKLLIEIDDEIVESAKTSPNYYPTYHFEKIWIAIVNGTLLPKGHGDLKDFEKIYADMKEKEELARQRVIDTPTNSPCYMRYVAQLNERTTFKEMLYDAPTIIEADKEGE